LLRQQLMILRQVKHPSCTKADRMILVFLARAVHSWKQVLFIVQPDTLLCWHRHLFCWYWRQRSKPISREPKLSVETVTLIKSSALSLLQVIAASRGMRPSEIAGRQHIH
jgi:putative transposase